jgi:K+/H+ antiporter YhaU regulatory subunit KhtT
VTVLAVSRSGRSFLNPGPEFQLFPGDRLILSGEPTALDRAVEHLSRVDFDHPDEEHDFELVEVPLARAAHWHGRTLAQLELRNRFGVSVVSIRRPDGEVMAPGAHYVVAPGDRLVLAGTGRDVARVLHVAGERHATTPASANDDIPHA